LIKLWAGLERPTGGSALVLGKRPSRAGGNVLPLLAYIPQTPALYRELTVRDHLALAAHLRRGFDPVRAQRHLSHLSIDPERRCGELSGGEAAQVSLAIALGTRAPILLLDEPLASLDPLARREFLDLLRQAVHEEGSTAVLSSHVVADIEQGCDALIVLGVGRVLLSTTLSQALQDHVVADKPAQIPDDLVAQLPHGMWLLRSSATSAVAARPTSLEDIVLGYLSRGREAAQ
jgi:ABC-2 type transport system ATP-binding protein